MRWQRRGFRRGTMISPRGFLKEMSDNKKALPVSWEELYQKMMPLLRPKWNGTAKEFSGMYRSLSKEQQKNLTEKIAGQILFAHSDVVRDILQNLSKISLDLSQQTEVNYRRLKLVDRFF